MAGVAKATFEQVLEKLSGKGEKSKKNGKDKAREALIQGVIAVVFAVIQLFYVDENFKCPCYNDPTEENCNRAKLYSIVFIAMTTLGAGFAGFVILSTIECVLACGKNSNYTVKYSARGGRVKIQPSFTEAAVVTIPSAQNVEEGGDDDDGDEVQENPPTSGRSDGGEQGRAQRNPPTSDSLINFSYDFRTKYFCKNLGEAGLICLAWFSLLLLDGDYIACATVCHPYGNNSCMEIRGTPQDELPFTLPFARARRISQYFGMGLLAGVVILMAVVKFCNISCKACACGCDCSSNCGCCRKCCKCEYKKPSKAVDDKREVEKLVNAFQEAAESAARKAIGDLQK